MGVMLIKGLIIHAYEMVQGVDEVKFRENVEKCTKTVLSIFLAIGE